jgi:hypothetical protein
MGSSSQRFAVGVIRSHHPQHVESARIIGSSQRVNRASPERPGSVAIELHESLDSGTGQPRQLGHGGLCEAKSGSRRIVRKSPETGA